MTEDNEKKIFSWEITFSADKEWASLKGLYVCGDSFSVRIDKTSLDCFIYAQVSLVCACRDFNPECELCTLDDGPLCTFDSCERVLSPPDFDSAEEVFKSLSEAAETAWYRLNILKMDDYHPDGDIWDWGIEE